MGKQYKKDESSRRNRDLQIFSQVSQIGTTIAAAILVGVLFGKFFDSLLGTAPWLLLIFSLLGVGAAIKSLFDISKEK